MIEVRELPEQSPRVESGPTQFGSDWCGLFLRGDNALAYALAVEAAMHWIDKDAVMVKTQMANLLADLRSCDERLLPRRPR